MKKALLLCVAILLTLNISAQTEKIRYYKIQVKSTGMYLGINGKTDAGTYILQQPKVGDGGIWYLEDSSHEDWYYIKNAVSKLTIGYQSKKEILEQRSAVSCNSYWKLISQGGQYFKLQNCRSDKFMSAAGATRSDAPMKVVQNVGDDGIFKFIPVDGPSTVTDSSIPPAPPTMLRFTIVNKYTAAVTCQPYYVDKNGKTIWTTKQKLGPNKAFEFSIPSGVKRIHLQVRNMQNKILYDEQTYNENNSNMRESNMVNGRRVYGFTKVEKNFNLIFPTNSRENGSVSSNMYEFDSDKIRSASKLWIASPADKYHFRFQNDLTTPVKFKLLFKIDGKQRITESSGTLLKGNRRGFNIPDNYTDLRIVVYTTTNRVLVDTTFRRAEILRYIRRKNGKVMISINPN